MNDDRLIDLEMRITHQERAIEELQQTTYEQFLLIEKLEKQIKRLSDQMGGGGNDIGPANEKPPHY